MDNIMRNIKLEKITLSCGTGTTPQVLEKGLKLLKLLTDRKPVKTSSTKRIPAFGVRPGLPIGCKVTIRGKKAEELLKRLLESISNKLKFKQMNNGSFAFGIKEYIEIPGVIYQRDIGIMGLDVSVTLMRAGFRVKKRRMFRKIPKRHMITREETANFIKEKFNVEVEQNASK